MKKKIEIIIRGGDEDTSDALFALMSDSKEQLVRDAVAKLYAENPSRFKRLVGAMHGVMYRELGLTA